MTPDCCDYSSLCWAQGPDRLSLFRAFSFPVLRAAGTASCWCLTLRRGPRLLRREVSSGEDSILGRDELGQQDKCGRFELFCEPSHTFRNTSATVSAVAQVLLFSYWALSPESADSGLFIFGTRRAARRRRRSAGGSNEPRAGGSMRPEAVGRRKSQLFGS